jgi:hypothetical protein
MTKWKSVEGSGSVLISITILNIFWKNWRDYKINLNRDSRCLRRESNRDPLEHKLGALSLVLTSLRTSFHFSNSFTCFFFFCEPIIVFVVLKLIMHEVMKVNDKLTLRTWLTNPTLHIPALWPLGYMLKSCGQSNSSWSVVRDRAENLIAMRSVRNELQFMRFSYFGFPLYTLPLFSTHMFRLPWNCLRS